MSNAHGDVIVIITKGSETKTVNLNYLRIWKIEDGINWKIVVDGYDSIVTPEYFEKL